MTFDDGIQAAINLLSTKYPVNGGEYCSMNYLADADTRAAGAPLRTTQAPDAAAR